MLKTEISVKMAALYEQDFYEWTQRTADQLEIGQLGEVDLEHVAEEIRDMGKSERRQLENRLAVLVAHLLKWDAQPERRGNSWAATIRTQRIRLNRLLRQNPSLKPPLEEELPEIFELGALAAVKQTNLPRSAFPANSPYTVDELLSDRPEEQML